MTPSKTTRATGRFRRVGLAVVLAATIALGSLAAIGGPLRLGAAVAGAVADPPEFDVGCPQDVCTVEFTYVLDERADGHDVMIEWQTRPATGFNDNDADTVRRSTTAGVSHPVGNGGRFRYAVHDLIWHSDIRCDDTIEITITQPGVASAVITLTKPIPDDPGSDSCSDYGMNGEVT